LQFLFFKELFGGAAAFQVLKEKLLQDTMPTTKKSYALE
jgi:hypothetical protein